MEIFISPDQTIRVRSIRPVYEIREDSPVWKSQNFRQSSQIYEAFNYLQKETRENFIVVHLDNKNTILCCDHVAVGSLSACIVHPREIFKSVLLSSAAAILLVHNHPSGVPDPSREDIDITKRLKGCAELLGIRLLDHVIVGCEGYYSFADRGALDFP